FFILVGLKSIYPHHESLDLSVSILFLLPVALYSFAGIYLAGALMGIHLVQQKRMSFLDILFSTGIWYLLTIFSFGILILGSAYLHKLNNILKLLTWYPILGSTCALFLAEIITTVTLKSRK
ncbi:MAG TPA: hypothetical protein DEP42_00405, partial [Ruminococcaceae bacterium]|nr:hypothetical protein [Oscillospiraceae bacterium]